MKKHFVLAAAVVAALVMPASQGQAAERSGTSLSATLLASNQHPAVDQPGATGTATLTVDAGKRSVCYRIVVSSLSSAAVAAHIHLGGAAASGPVVVPFSAPATTKGADGTYSGQVSGCVQGVSSTLVAAIAGNPAGYYVNVHTTNHPAGEVRGQLSAVSVLTATLLASNQHPAVNQPGATGTATLTVDASKRSICYRIVVSGLRSAAVAAHIHLGGAAASGPVVVPFSAPATTKGADGTYGGLASGCVQNVAGTLVNSIVANPASYYVNVHTTSHPAGEVRGQLSAASILSATLLASNQHPAVDQPGATGTATLAVDAGKRSVCYQIVVSGLSSAAVAAHIHLGSAAASGAVVVPFSAPATAKGADSTYSGQVGGCVPNVDAVLIAAIAANPAGYYVNVHTTKHPMGEVRGQLAVDGHS